jgi:hypothetical protein
MLDWLVIEITSIKIKKKIKRNKDMLVGEGCNFVSRDDSCNPRTLVTHK